MIGMFNKKNLAKNNHISWKKSFKIRCGKLNYYHSYRYVHIRNRVRVNDTGKKLVQLLLMKNIPLNVHNNGKKNKLCYTRVLTT